MVLGEGENFFSREKKFSPSPNPNPFQEKRSTLLRPDFLSWLGFFHGVTIPPFSGRLCSRQRQVKVNKKVSRFPRIISFELHFDPVLTLVNREIKLFSADIGFDRF
ncbi:MAG: hypothetical protein J6S90_07855, partial [Lentisphaeria bacterium]|nr:hypothetical protein [Lentisphaeria bacterium]